MDTWENLSAALRAYGEAQRETWGTVGDVAIAKYLAGNCSAEERRSVEKAMDTYPACRELIRVLKEVLKAPEAPAPKPPEPTVPEPLWSAAGPVWELVDRLAARIGEDGTMVVSGFEGLLKGPETCVARAMRAPWKSKDLRPEHEEVETATWEIPLPGGGGSIHISIRPSRRPETWELHCKLDLPSATKPSPGGWLSVRNRDGRRVHAGPLGEGLEGREISREPVYLKSGEYRVSIVLGEKILQFPIEVGSLAAGS